MAKQNGKTPVAPNFKDVDKESAARAQQALAGGRQDPLKPAKNSSVSTDKNGVEYTRWTETMQITQAYRSVTKSGLMDVTIIGKIRQSATKENTGKKVFAHFYLNLTDDIPEGHEIMNDRSMGAIISLLVATGFMPAGGTLRGTLLDKMFPQKNQPNAASPLVDKVVIATVVQTLGPKKNPKTGKPVTDDDGEPILEKRDQAESFLPEADSDEDEDEEDIVEDDDEDESEEDEETEEDVEDEDADEDAEDEDEEEEEEDEEPVRPVKKSKAPVKKAAKPVVKKTAQKKKGR